MWDNLHTPQCKVASLLWFAHFGMRICEDAQLLSCSHLVDHQAFHPFSKWNWLRFNWSKVILGGYNMAFMCITSFNFYDLEIQRVVHAHFPPHCSSSSMFWDATRKSHFKLKTCPWKFHNQHWVKCIQNNPFIGLGS
jgi:hypothetical protein